MASQSQGAVTTDPPVVRSWWSAARCTAVRTVVLLSISPSLIDKNSFVMKVVVLVNTNKSRHVNKSTNLIFKLEVL